VSANTQDVTLFDDNDGSPAVVKAGSTSAGLPTGASGVPGIVLVGGVQPGTPDTYRCLKTDSNGQLYIANPGAGAQASITPVTSGSCAPNATVNVTVPTGYPSQVLLRWEIRPSVADNTFSLDVYKDSGRTKRIYNLYNVSADEFLIDDEPPMMLDAGGNMYLTIHNNNVTGSRTYTIEGVVEVRS
jgi:hypothetical protein